MYLIFLISLICPFNNLVTLAAVVCLVVRDTQDVQFPYAAGLLLLHSTRLKRLPMDERRARARRGRRTLHRMGACLIPTAEPQKLVPPDGGGGDGGDGGGGGGDGGSGGGGGGGGGSGSLVEFVSSPLRRHSLAEPIGAHLSSSFTGCGGDGGGFDCGGGMGAAWMSDFPGEYVGRGHALCRARSRLVFVS